eukprot:5831974-Prymnesium_polylepis.1
MAAARAPSVVTALIALSCFALAPVAAGSALGLPDGTLSPDERAAYARDVGAARSLARCRRPYSRHGGAHRSSPERPLGLLLVQPLQLRR